MLKYEAGLLWNTIAHGGLVTRLASIAGNIDLTLFTPTLQKSEGFRVKASMVKL